MKIKNILSAGALMLILLAISSCNNKKFQISGTITDANDSILYLENISLDGPVVLDSVKLNADGTFSFEQDATDAPEFYRLRIHYNILNVSIDSTETVTVKASYPTMAYQYDIQGSENCSKIKELALLQMGLQNQVNAIAKDPTLGVSAVKDSVTNVVEAYKENVKMNYIYKEPNKSYAYFALFQTFILGNSYNLIFNPQNSKEDIKAFAAVATSWDTFHPGAIRGENLHNIAIEGMKNVNIIRNREAQAQQVLESDKIDTSGILDISLFNNKGKTSKLSDLKGKVVMLDFCVYGAEGTTERILKMRELYDKYNAQGFEIYQVSFDSEEHFWKTQSAALPWISVFEPEGMNSELITKYNLMGLPTFFLLGRDNVVAIRDAQIKDLDKEIQSLL